MDLEEYARLLGRIVGNLHSLEFLLRAFLYANAAPPHAPMPTGVSLNTLNVGDAVPLNAFTDYDALGRLIDRYNNAIGAAHPECVVDPTIVDLRDALAHGRVSSPDPSNDLVLLKFDRPSGSATRVTYAQRLTADWLKDQARRVFAEIEKVAKAPGSPVVQGP